MYWGIDDDSAAVSATTADADAETAATTMAAATTAETTMATAVAAAAAAVAAAAQANLLLLLVLLLLLGFLPPPRTCRGGEGGGGGGNDDFFLALVFIIIIIVVVVRSFVRFPSWCTWFCVFFLSRVCMWLYANNISMIYYCLYDDDDDDMINGRVRSFFGLLATSNKHSSSFSPATRGLVPFWPLLFYIYISCRTKYIYIFYLGSWVINVNIIYLIIYL